MTSADRLLVTVAPTGAETTAVVVMFTTAGLTRSTRSAKLSDITCACAAGVSGAVSGALPWALPTTGWSPRPSAR